MFVNSIGMNFASIPAGSFLMGSPIDELERDDETQHLVHITKPFLLSTTTVTQGQWKKVMGNNPSHFNGNNLPVDWVSWHDAMAFCQKLSKQETITYRLPTEAEWEYACRAGTTTPFNTGETITHDLANYNSNFSYPRICKRVMNGNSTICESRRKTTPVGIFLPNAWGLYDMHGNVWEWCSDFYAPYPEGEIFDPDQQDISASDEYGSRVLRGGSWISSSYSCRSAYRNSSIPDLQDLNFGFRLAIGAGVNLFT